MPNLKGYDMDERALAAIVDALDDCSPRFVELWRKRMVETRAIFVEQLIQANDEAVRGHIKALDDELEFLDQLLEILKEDDHA